MEVITGRDSCGNYREIPVDDALCEEGVKRRNEARRVCRKKYTAAAERPSRLRTNMVLHMGTMRPANV
jgi:hypothetical protein